MSTTEPSSTDEGAEAFVTSIDRFAGEVLPVWSGHIESSRTQMEQAVGALVQRFGRIVQLLSDTLDVTNHGTGQGHEEVVARSRERLGEVLDALDAVARERRDESSPQNDRVVEAAALVRTVVDDLVVFGQILRQATERLELTSLDVQQEISQSLVQMQFQDRIGQTLEHVRDGIDAFAPLLERARAGGTGTPGPVDTEALLALLRSSYTMAEEHELHGAGVPVPVHDTEITFF